MALSTAKIIQKCLEENLFQCHFSHHIHHTLWSGTEHRCVNLRTVLNIVFFYFTGSDWRDYHYLRSQDKKIHSFFLQCLLILNVGQKFGNIGHSLHPVQISANVQNSKNNLFYFVNVYSSFRTACHYYVMTYQHTFFNLIINTISLNISVSSLSSVIHVWHQVRLAHSSTTPRNRVSTVCVLQWSSWMSTAFCNTNTVIPELKSSHQPHTNGRFKIPLPDDKS